MLWTVRFLRRVNHLNSVVLSELAIISQGFIAGMCAKFSKRRHKILLNPLSGQRKPIALYLRMLKKTNEGLS